MTTGRGTLLRRQELSQGSAKASRSSDRSSVQRVDAGMSPAKLRAAAKAAQQLLLTFTPALPKHTIAQALERFRLEEMATQKPQTRAWMDHYALKIERSIGRRLVDGEFRGAVLVWRANLPPTPAMFMGYLLGRLLRCCQRWGWRTEEHDLRGLCSIRSKSRDRVFTLPQRVELLRYLSRPTTARRRVAHDVIAFLLHSGWRVSEACDLQWSWIDVGESTVRLPDTKSNEAQTRPLSSEAMQILLSQPRRGQYVFPGKRSGPVTRGAVLHVFRKIRTALGLHGLVLHSARHTVCTVGAQLKLSPKFIATLVGHTAEWQLATYTHPSEEDLRDTADAVSAGLVRKVRR